MNEKSKNKFTSKIILSYLVLSVLTAVCGFFIYTEMRPYLSLETPGENDAKLLKTGSFLTQLYEAESLSKLALQTRAKKNFTAYSQKIDSVFIEIDSLKLLTTSDYQRGLLDSVQLLLCQKVANGNDLRNLKVKNNVSSSIDKALKEFKKMEASFGKLTIENFEKNPEKLSSYQRKVLNDWVAYLNANIPPGPVQIDDSRKIDSILNTSMALLAEAKKNDAKTQRSLAEKEIEINRNDLELSQQLRNIISTFEQEILTNAYNDNLKKKSALKRGIRLAGITAILGFIIVGIFTFLINRDFWRIQTYRQKLEKEKKYSESLLKSREQLISTVSHDLRTPLNSIIGYSELMENTKLSPKQDRFLKNIKSASQYVGNLVNDLLDFSKLEAGKLNTEKSPFITSHLIQETAENLQEIHSNKNLKLHLDIDEALQKTVLGDSFRLRQILTNLIGNAFKFTENGSITITARASKGSEKEMFVEIHVTDTGIGIPKEKQSLIFKEFSQADASTEKKYGGYGLGLTISKKLTELLKGSLSLESKLGEGSTFKLQLPLEITTALENPKAHGTAYLGPKLRMLIIDDDSALLRMLGELAESMGIMTHTFSNFLQIEKDALLAYDIVLTDIQMPQINGFAVLKKLKSGEYLHYKNQPIVAMTGRKDLHSEAYVSLGFAQVLLKPFSKSELIALLKLLGFETEKICDAKILNVPKEQTSKIYSLAIIQSFLGENEEAIHEVLQTFLKDTETNIGLLKESIYAADYTKTNHVAHRMLPMFRQLKVGKAVLILENLELANSNTMNASSLQKSFDTLTAQVHILVAALKKRLTTTSLTYSD